MVETVSVWKGPLMGMAEENGERVARKRIDERMVAEDCGKETGMGWEEGIYDLIFENKPGMQYLCCELICNTWRWAIYGKEEDRK